MCLNPTSQTIPGPDPDSTHKGKCHEMNNFLKVVKIKSVLSVFEPMVLKLFCCLDLKKMEDKVLASFFENTY
jgi:hypothetical protein